MVVCRDTGVHQTGADVNDLRNATGIVKSFTLSHRKLAFLGNLAPDEQQE